MSNVVVHVDVKCRCQSERHSHSHITVTIAVTVTITVTIIYVASISLFDALSLTSFLTMLLMMVGKPGTLAVGLIWPWICILTFAKSMGWITQEANMAALPPHTNGSAFFATVIIGGASVESYGYNSLLNFALCDSSSKRDGEGWQLINRKGKIQIATLKRKKRKKSDVFFF